jgi:phosphopantothenoylcysteine decarboxylase/phosphopantothenate--cysteine ligase
MRILLGITGGIAAYKTPDLVRRLRGAGHEVQTVVTDNAARLVAPEALAAVSGHRVWRELWPGDGSFPHIDVVRWCQCLLVAPATANCLARFAHGLAEDLLSTAYLAIERRVPVIVAPAMNSAMWAHPAVQRHLAQLRADGVHIVPPVSGVLACGEEGVGALAPIEELLAAVTRAGE